MALVRGLHRIAAIRIIRGHRTVSYTSATVLAAPPPPLSWRPSHSRKGTKANKFYCKEDPRRHSSTSTWGKYKLIYADAGTHGWRKKTG
jgi:hypothetical protein